MVSWVSYENSHSHVGAAYRAASGFGGGAAAARPGTGYDEAVKWLMSARARHVVSSIGSSNDFPPFGVPFRFSLSPGKSRISGMDCVTPECRTKFCRGRFLV